MIEALVGEGGFAEVYRARQTESIARFVAIKLIKPGMDSRALLARFATGTPHPGTARAPGIARILDAGATATGRPFVVVEFVDGVSLQRYAAERSHAVEHLLTLFLQVCDAVAQAHRCLVIHSDLKPDNVMVVGFGEQARAIVAGGLADARPMLEAVAARAMAARGVAHPRTRVLADMRAKLAFDSGNPAEAEAPLRELLALEEADGNAAGIVATAGNLAQVLLGLRRTDEARTLALRARTHGLDHPLTFAAVRKLAAVHLASGDHAAMHRELEPVLAPARQRLGASHPDFLGLLNYQAAALQGLGRAEEPSRLLRELVATQATKLGRLHPQAMMALSNYGILLAGKREFAAAEPILRDAAERFAAARGAQDLESVKARYQHARVVAALGRHREIAPDLATAVAEIERQLPGNSTFLASARQAWLEHLEQLAREHEAAAEFDAAAASCLTAMEVADRLGRPADSRRAAKARAAALRR